MGQRAYGGFMYPARAYKSWFFRTTGKAIAERNKRLSAFYTSLIKHELS